MHLHLDFRQLFQITLNQLILDLLLFTTAYAATSVDSQFDVVAKTKLFVDRSLLIQHLFDKQKIHPWITNQHIIIGARKSGKSTNLSMMKQFFEVRVDDSGRVLLPNTTKHYTLFKSLTIGRWPAFEQFFARIPVIHLNLADFVVKGSKKDFRKSFCKVLRDLMTEHKYLFQNMGEHDYMKESLGIYRDAETCQKQRMFDLKLFGQELAALIHAQFKTRVLVLIDEIDAPAMSILDPNVTSVNEDFIRDVFQFVTNTIENTMTSVMGSFLTGATHQATLLGDMSVFTHYAFDENLKYFYGVTEAEVRRLLSISDIPITKTLMQELRDMYGGHGYTDEESKEFVYNTQSILKFCERQVMKPYWDAASGIRPFRRLLSPECEGSLVEEAMHHELFVESIHAYSEGDIFKVKDFLSGKNDTLEFWWSMEGYMWESGFFANCPTKRSVFPGSWRVRVPNTENRLILLDTILNKDYYMAKHGVNEKVVHSFVISVAKFNESETSFHQIAECISNLFVKATKEMDNEAVLRYPLYNYLRQADAGLFSEVTAELGRKTERKSDIIVKLKDGSKVFVGLTLDRKSGLDALKQVLEDEQLQKFGKVKSCKFFCLGINLVQSKRRFDVSYLHSSTNIKDARNTTRFCPNT